MRYKSLLAATALLASGLAFSTPAEAAPAAGQAVPASARKLPECKPAVPAKLIMRRRTTVYTIGLDPKCPATLYNADWRGIQPGDPEKTRLEFLNGDDFAELELSAFVSPIGAVTWTPLTTYGTGEHGENVAVLKTTPSVTKYASSGAVSGKRVGGTTTIVATVGYYNPKANAFVRWPSKAVTLQYKVPGSTKWLYLRKVTTNKVGQAAFTWTPKATRYYRAVVPTNTTIWDFTTAAISK